MTKRNIIMALTALLLFTACAEVKLCDTTEEEHPHVTWLSLGYNLANMNDGATLDRVDSMVVIAYRVVGQWRTLLKTNIEGRGNFISATSLTTTTDTDSNTTTDQEAVKTLTDDNTGGSGTDDNSDNKDNTGDSGTDDNTDNSDNTTDSGTDNSTEIAVAKPQPGVPTANDTTAFCIKPGDYRFYSISYDTTEVDYRNFFEYMVNVGEAAHTRPADLYAVYKQHVPTSPLLHEKLIDWDDYNPYANYIQPDIAPVYFGKTEVMTMEKDAKNPIKVDITPANELQQVDVNFTIAKDIAATFFVVDSVWIDISGIPYRISIETGHLDITYTSKAMKKMTLTNSSGTEGDKMDNMTLSCKATLYTNGIVRPYDSEEGKGDARQRVFGPGLLQAIIFTHSNEQIGTTGKLKGKRFQCMVNLYDALTASPSIISSDDGTYYSHYSKHCIINIDKAIGIDGKHITSSADNEGGVVNWQEWQRTSESDLIIEI